MRKIIAVATLGLVFGVASAAGPQDQSLQGVGYVGLSFGGHKAAPHDFRYGLRFDQDAYYANSDVPVGAPFAKDRPALLQFEFNSRGLSAANVNGLSALKRSYRLQQNEGAPAAGADQAAPAAAAQPTEQAPPEEEGFFSRTWHKVTHFFGGGDDKKTETASTEEKPAPAPEEDVVTDGTFMGYNAIDWGVLAVGAVGLGYIASEVNNGTESPDSYTTGGGGTGGGTSGGTTGGTTSVCIPTTPICVPYSTAGGNRWATSLEPDKLDPSYQKWLDGGTGQMGDLGG